MENTIKSTIDAMAIANVVATIIGWLPAIAALLSIVWVSVQLYDRFKSRKSKNP